MTPEAKVLAACQRLLTNRRDAGEPIHWFKIAGGPRQQVGQPDLLICYHGRFIAAEVKAPGKDATPLQQHRLEQWRKAGATVGVVTSAYELDQLLLHARWAIAT